MNKEVLRKVYLEKRLMLSVREWEDRCRIITDLFFRHINIEGTDCIHVYLPIDGRNEPDVWRVVNRIRTEYPQKKICISRCVWKDYSLKHFIYESPSQLEMNKYGIPEPMEGGTEVADEEIDLVLVPLITFDRMGNRIGYGGGFYDRFLEKLPPNTLKVGFTLAVPLDSIPYVEPFDIALDSAICPLGYQEF